MARIRRLLQLQIDYREMPISEAIGLLRAEQERGATHAHISVRWRAPTEEKQREGRDHAVLRS